VTSTPTPTAPGAYINISTAAGGAGNAAPNATGFFAGFADRGAANTAVKVVDALDYADKYGGRSGSSAVLSDSLELAFGEGLGNAYVSRVVGPSAAKGTLTLKDRSTAPGANTLTVTAAWFGADSASISVQVTDGTVSGTFSLLIFDALVSATVPAEEYDNLPDVATAVATVNPVSSRVQLSDAGSTSTPTTARIPLAISATALSAGTDDRSSAVDAQWLTALGAFDIGLGPGLVLFPGRATAAAHAQLIAAAALNFRYALLDTADLASVATDIALAATDAAVPGVTKPGDVGMLLDRWVQLPPAPGSSVARYAPPSAYVVGLISRVDSATGHSNQAPMGQFGRAQYAIGVHGAFLSSDRLTLNARAGQPGVSCIRAMTDGSPELYGFRSVSADPANYFAANTRQTLLIRHNCHAIGENYVGRQIDGRGHVFSELNGDLRNMLLGYYNLDALYGATASAAFSVDTSGTVNTAPSIAQGLIRARITFIPSPTGERVVFDLTRQGVPA
jgi:phage tail sheath protein FI